MEGLLEDLPAGEVVAAPIIEVAQHLPHASVRKKQRVWCGRAREGGRKEGGREEGRDKGREGGREGGRKGGRVLDLRSNEQRPRSPNSRQPRTQTQIPAPQYVHMYAFMYASIMRYNE